MNLTVQYLTLNLKWLKHVFAGLAREMYTIRLAKHNDNFGQQICHQIHIWKNSSFEAVGFLILEISRRAYYFSQKAT